MSPSEPGSGGRDLLRQTLNLILAVAQIGVIVVGALTSANDSFDTRSPDESPVVPAQYAFVIWGVVYPACVAYAVFQALPRQRPNALLRRVGFYTASAFLATALWAVAAQNRVFWLTPFIMVWICASLVGALLAVARRRETLTGGERAFVALPIGLFAGWTTAAVFANTASVLKGYGFGNFGLAQTVWAAALVLAAGVLSALLTRASRGNVWYAAALVWAFVGIVVANAGSQTLVASAAGASAALVVISCALTRLSDRGARGTSASFETHGHYSG